MCRPMTSNVITEAETPYWIILECHTQMRIFLNRHEEELSCFQESRVLSCFLNLLAVIQFDVPGNIDNKQSEQNSHSA